MTVNLQLSLNAYRKYKSKGRKLFDKSKENQKLKSRIKSSVFKATIL